MGQIISLNKQQITALAPDAASVKASEKLQRSSQWSLLAYNERALWGLCQGSGKLPYQTAVDLREGFVTRCSCPSRKFPCKHALALLYLAEADSGAFTTDNEAEWVSSWLDKRAETAERKRQKAEENAGKPIDLQAQEKRREQRHTRILEGIEELQLWIEDLIRTGLIRLDDEQYRQLSNMSRRMVDAQMPAIAGRLGALVYVEQSMLFDELSQIYLLAEAYKHIKDYPDDLQAELRKQVGYTIGKEEVMRSDAIHDQWLVVSESHRPYEKLEEYTIWLYGRVSRHLAHVRSYLSPESNSWERTATQGTAYIGRLYHYPGLHNTRALLDIEEMCKDSFVPEKMTTMERAFEDFRKLVVANPFITEQAYFATSLSVLQEDGAYWLADSKHKYPLSISESDFYSLMAQVGGKIFASLILLREQGIKLLSIACDDEKTKYVPKDELLLKSALLGTERQKPSYTQLPDSLQAVYKKLISQGENKPEAVLCKMNAGLAIYKRAGLSPYPLAEGELELKRVSPAPDETLYELPEELSTNLLSLIYASKNTFLRYCYGLLEGSGYRLPSAYVYTFVYHCTDTLQGKEQALLAKALQPLLGERGKWLLGLMGKAELATDDFDWATATFSRRLAHFRDMRESQPQEALELLLQDWAKEKADRREAFLGEMWEGLNRGDEAFLTEVWQKDRSNIVRVLALRLLWHLPGSQIQERGRELLREHHQKQFLLGWKWKEISYSDELKSLGIEELSPIKGESDSLYILRQIAEYMPLDFWTDHYTYSPQEAAERLVKKPPMEHFDCTNPICAYADKAWAKYAYKPLRSSNIKTKEAVYGLLDEESWEGMSTKDLLGNMDSFVRNGKDEWSKTSALTYLYSVKYSYNPEYSDIELLACRLPVSCLDELTKVIENCNSGYNSDKLLKVAKLLLIKKEIQNII